MPNQELIPYSKLSYPQTIGQIANFIIYHTPALRAPDDLPAVIQNGIKNGKFPDLADALGRLQQLDMKDDKAVRDPWFLAAIALFALFASLITAWLRHEGEQSGVANIAMIVVAGLGFIVSGIGYLIVNARTELNSNRIERFTHELKYYSTLQLAEASERIENEASPQPLTSNVQIQQESQPNTGNIHITPSETLHGILQQVVALENANRELTRDLAETRASLLRASSDVNSLTNELRVQREQLRDTIAKKDFQINELLKKYAVPHDEQRTNILPDAPATNSSKKSFG